MTIKERFHHEWQNWSMLGGVREWLVDSYGRVINFVDPLSHRGNIAKVRLRDKQQPYAVRLAMGDRCVLFEIFANEDYAIACRHNTDAKTILDLGAHVGFSVRLWLERCPQARILAVEADERNFAVARRNVELSGQAHRSEVINAAVAAVQPGQKLYISRDHAGFDASISATRNSDDDCEVTACGVSELLDRLSPGGSIDLLKCDIEGSEKPIFKQCADWIGRVHSIMIETHEPYTVPELMEDIARNGGKFRLVQENHRPGFAVAFLLREPDPAK
ncbi:hypothetical protein BH09PLA1_BH09PLA1_32620 [soil metagenome]